MPVRSAITNPGNPSELIGVSPPMVTISGGIPKGRAATYINPVQVIGFVPMVSCADTECRELVRPDRCFKLPVFGLLTGGIPSSVALYENDFNSFLVDYSLVKNNPGESIVITWKIQKLTDGEWVDAATISGTTYGTIYNLGNSSFSNAGHASYTGVQINWGKVLHELGAGCYRIKLNTDFATENTGSEPVHKIYCMISVAAFDLKAWDCRRAHRTVKFESYNTGTIGDIYQDYKSHNVCNIIWYDSIRFYAKFGDKNIDEYLRLRHKYGNGLQTDIHDEAIQKWVLNTELLPQWLLDRLSVYGMMTKTLKVSDYNMNNSDYAIKGLHVIPSSNFKPKYYDKNWLRRGQVTVEFERGVQSIIKSLCCDTGNQASETIGG